jgi:hypothetical protein
LEVARQVDNTLFSEKTRESSEELNINFLLLYPFSFSTPLGLSEISEEENMR